MSNQRSIDMISDHVSAYIENNADQLVAEWIDWLKDRLDTNTVHSLPDKALRNHIPPVIISISKYVRTPLEMLRSEILSHLDLHGRIRWEQGYNIEEILAEFEGLATIVMDKVINSLADFDETVTPSDVVQVINRLSTGLRAIGYITVGIYRNTELVHSQQTATQLEEFARSIAHELRTPLQAISLTTSMLFDDEIEVDKSKKKDHLAIILDSIERSNDLLSNLHVLAMIEGSRASGNKVTLLNAIQTVVDELKEFANEKEVELIISEDIPDMTTTSTPVHIALVNLVSNSIKYSDAKKDKSWCKVSSKLLHNEDSLNMSEFTIEDNGIGIPGDLLSTVFARNTRAHPEIAHGTGLGLSIFREVITQHGGKIDISSTEKKGTIVTFTLPVLENLPSKQENELSSNDLAEISIESLYNHNNNKSDQ